MFREIVSIQQSILICPCSEITSMKRGVRMIGCFKIIAFHEVVPWSRGKVASLGHHTTGFKSKSRAKGGVAYRAKRYILISRKILLYSH